MGLFGNKVNVNKLLQQALADYKSGNFSDCYDKVSQAAATGNGRAEFCLALLGINHNVVDYDDQDNEAYFQTIKKAVEHKYQLAAGVYAKNLEDMRMYDELVDFCRGNRKSDDSSVLYFVTKEALGCYCDDEMQPDEKTATAAAQKCLKSALYEISRLEKNDTEYVEFQTYNPFGASADMYNRLGRAYMANFFLCYMFLDKYPTSELRSYYNDAMKYLWSPYDRFRLARQFTVVIFANEKQLGDVSLANGVMEQLKDAFENMPENEQEAFRESYDQTWDKYDEFLDEANERLANRGAIIYDNSVADKNFLNVTNVLGAIESWAKSVNGSSSTQTVYTIGGRRYTRGEFGYLFDEQGFRSNYRVDDYGRLYIGDSLDDIGYFNNDGLFIES